MTTETIYGHNVDWTGTVDDACLRPISSSSVFTPSKKTKKYCIVCRWEDRGRLIDHSMYCEKHKVSLCCKLYPDTKRKPWHCQNTNWTCWEKYHVFYKDKNLFTAKGNVSTSNELYILKKQAEEQEESTDEEPSAKKVLVM